MRLTVKAHPKSKKPKLVDLGNLHFEVWVREIPEDGKANKAIIQMLSQHLKLPQSSFFIKSGHRSKNKMIEC